MAYKNIRSYDSIKYISPPGEDMQLSKLKEKQWYIANCESLLNGFVRNSFQVGYDSKHLKKLRAYAEGTQGNQMVKEKLLRWDKGKGEFKGRMKNVFQTCDVLPEMLGVIMAINMKAQYDLTALAYDESSIKDRNLEKNVIKFMTQKQTRDYLTFAQVKIDNGISEEDLSSLNDADIEMLYDGGGLQLLREKVAAAVCNVSKEDSGHKTVENYATKDSVDFGIVGTKVYVDYSTGSVLYRNVDMQNVLLPRSKFNDFRDITRCGELVWMSLVDIVKQAPELDKDKIQEIILGCMSYNSAFSAAMMSEHIDGWFNYENSIFDDFKIPVVDAQWLSVDRKTYLELKHSTGGLVRNKVKEDYVLSNKEKKRDGKLERKKFIKKYEALWVVGTDILLKAEEASHNVYYGPKGNRIPELDYSFVKMGTKPIVERCIPYVDDINLAEVKLRNAIAKIPPGPRMIIYNHALQNIKFGGIRQSREDLLSALEETGYMIVNSMDEKGNVITANGGKVVDFIPSGIVEDITVFENTIQSKIARIRQVIGLPEGLDGTSGNPYQGLGKQQLAAAASSNALYPTLSLIGPLFEKTFNKVSAKKQSIARGTEGLKVTDMTESETNAKIYELTEEYSNADFRIKLTFAPTEEERAQLMQQINEMSIQYTQSGGTMGCNKSEYFLLEKLIRMGRIEDARYRIARIEKQREIIGLKITQANNEANMQANQAAAEAKGAQDRANIVVKEEEARKTALATKAMDGVNKSTQEYLKSKDTETSSISPEELRNMANLLLQYASSMVPQQQQEQPVDMQNEQVPQEVPMQ